MCVEAVWSLCQALRRGNHELLCFYLIFQRNFWFISFLVLSVSYVTVIYGFMLWCGVVVYLFIERAGKSMSEKTRYMQRQMNRLMMAEVLLQISFVVDDCALNLGRLSDGRWFVAYRTGNAAPHRRRYLRGAGNLANDSLLVDSDRQPSKAWSGNAGNTPEIA